MSVARIVLTVLTALVALAMGANAFLWLFRPTRAAEILKMPLLSGDALSSQMDIGALFLGMTTFTVIGLLRRRPEWFLATATLFLGAAFYRTMAWVLHGASFLPDMVIPELVMGSLLVAASRYLTVPAAART